jgi:hypothetical protein
VSDFIKHNGAGRPHCPSTHVEVKFRDGRIERGKSCFLRWPWAEDCDGDERDDVLEWRAVPEPPTKGEIIADLLGVLEGWQTLHDQMVEAGGDLAELPPGLVERFAHIQRDLMVRTDAAIAKARGEQP